MTFCGSESLNIRKTPMIKINEMHDNNAGCEFVTFVDIIKTARSMISDCDMTHCSQMSLFIFNVNRKDIDKI